MEKLLTQAKCSSLKAKIEMRGVTVAQISNIAIGKMRNKLDKLKDLIPEAKIFDLHKIKAAILDFQKSGKIEDLIKQDASNQKADPKVSKIEESKQKTIFSSGKKSTSGKREEEIITPDKKKNFGKHFRQSKFKFLN